MGRSTSEGNIQGTMNVEGNMEGDISKGKTTVTWTGDGWKRGRGPR